MHSGEVVSRAFVNRNTICSCHQHAHSLFMIRAVKYLPFKAKINRIDKSQCAQNMYFAVEQSFKKTVGKESYLWDLKCAIEWDRRL